MPKNVIHINAKSAVPKYRQLIDSFCNAIESEELKLGDKLPSINQLCSDNSIKRDTLMFALNELKSRGIISSRQGKGYFVCRTDVKIIDRYFLMFDELNGYSGEVYNHLISALPENARADVFFHHNDSTRIDEYITSLNGNYTAYLIDYRGMENHEGLIRKLPGPRTCLIGKGLNAKAEINCVFQDHFRDMYESLRALRKSLKKYCRLILLCKNYSDYPGRTEGFERFCREENFEYLVQAGHDQLRPALYEAYFVNDDDVLVNLIAQIRKHNFRAGENLGLVTFSESKLNEITEGGLTTITPDFSELCKRLVEVTQGQRRGQIRVRSKIIQRNSL